MSFPSTSTFRLGLTGYPLGHSLSPVIHAAALSVCGLKGTYSLFPVRPEDRQGLEGLLERVRSGEIQGLNITIPHKQNVIPLLDELTPTARSIGAVNTVYLQDDKLTGDNTDAAGFLADLKKFLTSEILGHPGREALLLGAGGSARAVVYSLVNDGWHVTVAARRIEQARQLAGSFTGYPFPVTVHDFSDFESPSAHLQALLSGLSLLVNTTPVGMAPRVDRSPWPQHLPLPPRAAIYDLVYNPGETQLVREACARGLPATTGLGMLVEQAALSFELWTGCSPPRPALLKTVSSTAP